MYNDFETKVSQVIDHHAPIKYRYPRKNSVPYMNRELRKAIYKKQMLRSKFEKYKTNKTWEAYRKQRNLVTKLKRKSINTYFQERCTGGQKSKHFYTTVKPFLSKKSTGSQQKIVLVENDKIVNNTKDICDTFNTFFVNVANDIGKDVIFDGNSHPSILKIKNNTQHNTLFDFKPTDVDTINKLVICNIYKKGVKGITYIFSVSVVRGFEPRSGYKLKTINLIFAASLLSTHHSIGKDVIFDGNSHPSILKIKNNTQHNTLFDFKPTDVDTINKLVNKINIKKATGVDQISSKLLRAGAPVLNKHITYMPTLPIYAVVYRFFKSSTDFKKNVIFFLS
jgi:orotidine-5'-phosphate decarboxylase